MEHRRFHCMAAPIARKSIYSMLFSRFYPRWI